jgi:hypothetical protein
LPTVWTGRHVFFLDRQVLIGWLGPWNSIWQCQRDLWNGSCFFK